MRTKTNFICFRATDKEVKKLYNLSQKSKLSRSKTICNLINNSKIYEAPKIMDSEVKYQLSMIGNNINQIAKVANATGEVDIKNLEERVDELYGCFENQGTKEKF